MPSFSIALTGLKADAISLNTIGNNLANLNTTAFKKQDANFADLFYQNVGSSGSGMPLEVGSGTRISSITSDFTQGTIATTDNSTDMAISGNGFFVVKDEGTQELTRSGNFTLDSAGNMTTTDGLSVMGYPAKNGIVDTNASLSPIAIPVGKTQLAQGTSEFSITAALNSTSTVGTQFQTSQTMYDSLGTSHQVNMSFTKTGDNQWSYSFSLPDGESSAASGNSGTLTFNSDGSLATPAANVTGINFTGMSDGSADISLKWDLYGSNGTGLITQTATTSAVNQSTQNGHASGAYKGFSVDSSGVITIAYSNGETEKVGQVALATVANSEGLTRIGQGTFGVTDGSGLVSIGVAGTGNRGTIEDDSLEQSNVDISTEFANMIVAQRSFEANSKTVTAFDTVTQDTIGMIR